MTFDQILVPLDGSSRAEAALAHAAMLARAGGGDIHLLHVMDTRSQGQSHTDSLDWRLRRAQALDYLQSLASRPIFGPSRVQCHVTEGHPADRIHDFVRDREIDLVVSTACGEGESGDFALGGTAHKISELHDVSFAVVGTSDGTVPESRDNRRILVPVDGTRRSEGALGLAAGLTANTGAEIVVLQVVVAPELHPRVVLNDEARELCQRLLERNRQAGIRYLESLVDHYAPRVTVKPVCRVSQRVATSILEVANEEKVDLILMTPHADGDPEENRRECSTCRSVVMRSRRPVLVLRDHGVARRHRMPQSARPYPGRGRTDVPDTSMHRQA